MLPMLLRFRDLKAMNYVQSWPQLKSMIENEGFPRGRRTSPNIRTWTEDEVAEWYAARPVEHAPLRGYAKHVLANKAATASPKSEGA
jgi:predicted DNA-binding transcriptional regulator AlpA